MRIKYSLAFFALFLLWQRGVAQSSSPEFETLASSFKLLSQQYSGSFLAHPQLFNGPEYVDYSKVYHQVTGHQFFLFPDQQQGSVYYNEHNFENVSLAYDLVLDQVVLKHPTTPLTLRLVNDNVRAFSIADHRFIRIASDSLTKGVMRTGYYEVLVDGTAQVFAKRIKRKHERIEQKNINAEFVQENQFFIQKAGLYYPVKSKGSIVKLFSDKKELIQKYLQTNNLKFSRKYREQAITKLVSYYNSLAAQ